MIDKVYPMAGSPASVLLLHAMSEHADKFKDKSLDLFEIFNIPMPEAGTCVSVDVEFKVNGVELPYSAVINELFETIDRTFDREILKRAESLISEAGLDNALQAIRDADWAISDLLSKAQKKQREI